MASAFSHACQFLNARLLIDGEIKEGELWVSQGKIVAPQRAADEVIDVQGKILAPGFIDLQINGAFGCDFSRNPQQIAEVAKHLLQFGVTAFFPTVVSLSPEQYRVVLPSLQPSVFDGQRAANLGIHLEGPFFAPECLGAHNPQHRSSQTESLEAIYGDLQGVKLITLAPELLGAEAMVKALRRQGIVISAGHSAATYQQMKIAIGWGVGLATHLFNAMKPFHHREPGIIGAVLLDPQLPYSMILDGVHVTPEAALLCWKCNPEGLILVTDATEVLGLPDGYYQLGSVEIESIDSHVYVKGTQTIAGSKLSLNKAVQALHRITQCSIASALEAASLKPAKLAGLYPAKGTLSIGSDADFLFLTDELEVEATYIQGERVWEKEIR